MNDDGVKIRVRADVFYEQPKYNGVIQLPADPACETPECGLTAGVEYVSRTGGPDGFFCPACLKEIDNNGRENPQW